MSKKDQDDDLRLIKELTALFQEQDLAELEFRRSYSDDSHLKLRMARVSATQTVQVSQPVVAGHVAEPVIAVAPPEVAAADSSASQEVPESPEQHPGLITSPMVGTVYLQAEQGAPQFVKVGDQIQQGQTLLIIEAMKTMNFIPSPQSGTLKKVLVQDEQPVEFGAPLMIIE